MDQPRNIRPPAVAGKFYPADPVELREQVNYLLSQVQVVKGPTPKAVIAPHAGYVYSGPIAASAYARLIPDAETIRRIVLLGPAHYAAFPGLALPTVASFATPLGTVPLDLEAMRQLSSLDQVKVLEAAHAREHCLEVQLPFLQVILKEFKIVPLAVGDAGAEEIQQVLDLLWDGPETRFVISSDLSHYHDSQTARHLDRATAGAIEALAPERIGTEQACGFIPVRGMLQAARRHGLRARAVDLRNSGDTAGPRNQVVGYGAFTFEESAEAARIAG